MPPGSLKYDEPPPVHLQSKGMPQRRIPGQIPLCSRHEIPDWLNDCKSAKFCNKVDDWIINSRPLINQVIFGSFNMTLPPTFSMKAPKDTMTAGTGGGGKRKEEDDDKRD